MNLSLPTVSVTEGPEWANALNAAFNTVDIHDHSNGKGVRITPAGMQINANLNIDNNTFYNFKSTRYQEQNSALSGASNLNAIHSVLGNLYWTNGSGTAVQITSGGAIASVAGSASTFESTPVNGSITISSSDTFVYLRVDTTGARVITLPSAASVSEGRFYIIKDETGTANTNNITINRAGADTIDGEISLVVDSDFASAILVSDGTSKWSIA